MTTLIYRTTAYTFKVSNQTVTGVLSFRTSHGTDIRVATAEIVLATVPPQAQYNTPVSIDAGCTGAGQAGKLRRFTGLIIGIDTDLYPIGCRILARGYLTLADLDWNSNAGGTDLTNGGIGQTDQQMVSQLLADAGVTNTNIGGTGTILGQTATDQFTWREGQSALQFIDTLEQVTLGYKTFDMPSGQVNRSVVTQHPTTGQAASFTEGVDIEQGRLEGEVIDARNRIKVTGFDSGSGAAGATLQQANPLIPVSSGYITQPLSSPMIERSLDADPGNGLSCESVAKWAINELNIVLVKMTLTTPRDDQINPGMVITTTSPIRLRTDLYTNVFFVQNVSVQMGESGQFSQELIVLGAIGSTTAIVQPPVASFTLQVEQELVVLGGAEVTRYFVNCVSTSYSPAATITDYLWSAPTGTPTVGTGPSFTTVYANSDGQTITLKVTDSNGSTATFSAVINDIQPQSTANTRALYFAADKYLETYTGSAFRHVAEPNSLVAAVVANGPVWGAGIDALPSDNLLATTPTPSHPFGTGADEVTSLWIETDVDDQTVIAGSLEGYITTSADAGATWAVPVQLEAAPVLRVAINGSDPNQMFALYFDALWVTFNGLSPATNWTVFKGAPPGVSFNDLSLAAARSMIAGTDATGAGCLIEMTTQVEQAFPALSPPVTSIVSVTAGILQDVFYCHDDTGRTFASSAPGSSTMVQAVDLPVGLAPQPRGLWRDGSIPELLYIAGGAGGCWKTIDGFATAAGYYQIREPGTGTSPADAVYYQIGADGNLGTTAPNGSGNVFVATTAGVFRREAPGLWTQVLSTPADQVLSQYGQVDTLYAASAAAPKLQKSDDGGDTWATLDANLPAGTWGGAAVDDSGNVWLTMSSGVWKSSDGGATFFIIDSPQTGSNGYAKGIDATSGSETWTDQSAAQHSGLYVYYWLWMPIMFPYYIYIISPTVVESMGVRTLRGSTLAFFWNENTDGTMRLLRASFTGGPVTDLGATPPGSDSVPKFPCWVEPLASTEYFLVWTDGATKVELVGTSGNNLVVVLDVAINHHKAACNKVIARDPVATSNWWMLLDGPVVYRSITAGAAWFTEAFPSGFSGASVNWVQVTG